MDGRLAVLFVAFDNYAIFIRNAANQRSPTSSGSPLAPLATSSGSEIVWLKQAFKIPHFMATVRVMVDLLGLIAKYRNIATGSW